jgi:outer membrane protein assembly factor BamB
MLVVSIAVGNVVASHLHAEEPYAATHSVTPAQRLALEQIDQLISAGQSDEAVRLIVRTIDEGGGRLVAVSPGSEMTNDFVQFVPLTLFLQDRLLRWGETQPDVLSVYRQRSDAAAKASLDQALATSDFDRLRRLSDQVLATSSGDDVLLAVADLAMQRGWHWTAISALRRIDPRWQAVRVGQGTEPVDALGWEMVLPRMAADDLRTLTDLWADPRGPWGSETVAAWPFASYVRSDLDQAAIGLRLVAAYLRAGESKTADRLAGMLRAAYASAAVVVDGKELSFDQAMLKILQTGRDEGQQGLASGWYTLGGNATRVYQTTEMGDLPGFPSWIATLGVDDAAVDRLPDDPAIGWGRLTDVTADSRWDPWVIPIVHQGTVLVQRGDSVHAFDAQSGAAWPPENDQSVIYRDSDPAAIRPLAGRMPVDGEPWYTLSAAQGRVAGRFGPSQSGWLQVIKPKLPLSQLMVIDLQREGRAIEGYPFPAAELGRGGEIEFEGAPLIVGSRMYVGTTRRDDATMVATVACFDTASGQLLFSSAPLGSARLLVDQPASRQANSLVSYREGVVYYHGDTGTVSAIDANDGSIRWVLRYPRAEIGESPFPSRRRSQQVRSNPVALAGPLAIAGPSDLDRLIAIDAIDGRLLWTTREGEADDVDQILGHHDGKLVAGGDSLYQIDRDTGQITGRWPAGVTRQIHGALPQPRRHGRGLMAGARVYWPTRDNIWIFDAATLNPQGQLPLYGTPLVGGNLAAAGGVLIVSDGRHLAGYVSYDKTAQQSETARNQ